MSSIIPGKEFNQETSDKLEMKQQTSKSEPVLTKKRRKKKKMHSPQIQMHIVLLIQIAFHKLPTIRLTNYIIK